ncbi:MAG: hypothetical protein K8S27_00130 [Candidatus Omnitrophica bacterium]|nr:hypothetical protein [Candidatus Omnitrophota bacterium]
MNYDKEKVKQIILTDYLDGRLDADEKRKIDDLIAQHHELQSFYTRAVGCTVKPFEHEREDIVAPVGVWESIEDQLDSLEQRPSVVDRIFQPFVHFWNQPRIVLSGGIVVVFLMFVFFFYQQRQKKVVRYNQEAQIEYFILLVETSSSDKLEETIIETRLEKYFL